MMVDSQSRITLPELARRLGVTRATAERLVSQYGDRLGPVERFGIVRSWPVNAVESLRTIIAEEQRLREGGR
jgi:hypothetical protein